MAIDVCSNRGFRGGSNVPLHLPRCKHFIDNSFLQVPLLCKERETLRGEVVVAGAHCRSRDTLAKFPKS